MLDGLGLKLGTQLTVNRRFRNLSNSLEVSSRFRNGLLLNEQVSRKPPRKAALNMEAILGFFERIDPVTGAFIATTFTSLSARQQAQRWCSLWAMHHGSGWMACSASRAV